MSIICVFLFSVWFIFSLAIFSLRLVRLKQNVVGEYFMAFEVVDTLIEEDIKQGFPGAQLCVSIAGQIIKNQGYGFVDHLTARQKPITPHTYFDLASLTKIFAIVYPFQYLSQYHDEYSKIRGDVKINTLLYNFDVTRLLSDIFTTQADFFAKDAANGGSKSRLTLLNCLTHTAGFPSNPHYYDPKYSETLYFQSLDDDISKNRQAFLTQLLATPSVYLPDTQHLYSDPDFMLLTIALEALTGLQLDIFLKRYIFEPNHIKGLLYQPLLNNIPVDQIAPTEFFGNTRAHSIFFPNIRTTQIQGTVQDEKAFHCMNEISGHAGLFGTAASVVQALNLMAISSNITTVPFFNSATKAFFLEPSAFDPSFGRGWRLNTVDHMNFTFGDYASARAFGHTGWTGCVMIHDPEYELTIAYLTNRKHSHVIDPEKDPHRFYGDLYPAGIYRNIMNAVYQDLGILSHSR